MIAFRSLFSRPTVHRGVEFTSSGLCGEHLCPLNPEKHILNLNFVLRLALDSHGLDCKSLGRQGWPPTRTSLCTQQMSSVLVCSIRGHTGPLQSKHFSVWSRLTIGTEVPLGFKIEIIKERTNDKFGDKGYGMDKMKFWIVSSWSYHIVIHWRTQERKQNSGTGRCLWLNRLPVSTRLSTDCVSFLSHALPALTCPLIKFLTVPGALLGLESVRGSWADKPCVLRALSTRGERCHRVFTQIRVLQSGHTRIL